MKGEIYIDKSKGEDKRFEKFVKFEIWDLWNLFWEAATGNTELTGPFS